jgi:hypothetical protein
MTAVYGVTTSDDGPLDWSHAEERLERARNYWIATTRPDGTPHAAPVWGYGWRDRSTSVRAGAL